MFNKEHDERGHDMECHCEMGMLSSKFGKEFKLAHLKKKEKMIEAKLEFIREIRKLIEKSSSEAKENE
jgi:hypothetical protein